MLCVSVHLPASASAGQPRSLVAPAEDPTLAEAQALYKEGEVKFQTADYEDALELWKRAYAILPDGEANRAIRHALVYNIAEAHRRAYEVTRNPTHLRKAKILLDTYRAEHRALYGDEPQAVQERAEADDRIAELDAMIAASEAAGEVPQPLAEPSDATQTEPLEPQGEGVAPAPAMPEPQRTPQEQWSYDVSRDPVLGPKWSQGSRRVVGGAVLTGIGSVFAISGLIVFSAAPNAEVFSGAFYITGGIFTAIAVGLIVPGGVLIGRGVMQRREVLSAKPRPVAHFAPYMTPDRRGAGFGVTLRF